MGRFEGRNGTFGNDVNIFQHQFIIASPFRNHKNTCESATLLINRCANRLPFNLREVAKGPNLNPHWFGCDGVIVYQSPTTNRPPAEELKSCNYYAMSVETRMKEPCLFDLFSREHSYKTIKSSNFATNLRKLSCISNDGFTHL